MIGVIERSPETPTYNCIALSAGDDTRWWWPAGDAYWPEGVSKDVTLEVFIQAFSTLDYEPCDNYELESGFEKIVIFVDDTREPTHAAR